MARTPVARAGVSPRLLETWDDFAAAVEVIVAVWGESATSLASPPLLRTYAHYGNPVIGAFDGDRLCGVSIGFLAAAPEIHLHSHITGVVPGHQHLGIGYALKQAQRQWCLDHGIGLVTWTFDPMLARNAYFNLHKLGATARRLLPDFYGAMDDDLNRGDETDRLEVAWCLDGERGRPTGPVVANIPLPADYLALRAEDPDGARAWRATVRDRLVEAFAEGLEAVGFSRTEGYLLARS